MSKARIAVLCVSIGLLSMLAAGSGVYYWQWQVQKSKSAEYDDQIGSLQSSLTKVRSDLAAAAKTPVTTPVATAVPVLYTGDGASALSDSEKTEFTKKLTAPYIDFYAQSGQVAVASMLITVPVKKGDPFKVFAIRESGGLYENFSYSKRGSALDTWKPTCGPTACAFSDGYKTKYPDVVK
jgi:hypothetical protein